MLKCILATFIVISIVNTSLAQDKYCGKWSIKEVVYDPDSVMRDSKQDIMIFEKITSDYYRATINNSLLFKVQGDSLYSVYTSEVKASIIYIENDKLRMQITLEDPHHQHQDSETEHKISNVIIIWERLNK